MSTNELKKYQAIYQLVVWVVLAICYLFHVNGFLMCGIATLPIGSCIMAMTVDYNINHKARS